ncbi:MAG: DUF4332 domain-containing protein, partial [Phycisphaerales bacterium]|nr:DUF4332 domain-containing protein [Hyphomonadaceae bacterium]
NAQPVKPAQAVKPAVAAAPAIDEKKAPAAKAEKPKPKVIELDPPKPETPANDAAPPALEKPQKLKAPPLPRELPIGAPLAKRDKTLPKTTLHEKAPVVQAPSIGPKTAKRLEAVGVKTIADLLALNADEGESKIDAGHISAQVIRDWQAQALLACTVPGLRSREAQALVACGVTTAEELIEMDATELCDGVARWGLSDAGQRAWGSAPAPTEDDVATWIARAERALEQGKAIEAA